jgi:translation initiation factor IF-2
MTDNKTPEGEKTLHASGPSKTLSVKRPETGVVRQAFSHGRYKAVVVEIKRPTVVRPGAKAEGGKPADAPKADAPKPEAAAAPAPQQPSKPAKPAPVQPKQGGMVLRTLTEGEKEARMRALKDARIAEEEERRRAQEEAQRRA